MTNKVSLLLASSLTMVTVVSGWVWAGQLDGIQLKPTGDKVQVILDMEGEQPYHLEQGPDKGYTLVLPKAQLPEAFQGTKLPPIKNTEAGVSADIQESADGLQIHLKTSKGNPAPYEIRFKSAMMKPPLPKSPLALLKPEKQEMNQLFSQLKQQYPHQTNTTIPEIKAPSSRVATSPEKPAAKVAKSQPKPKTVAAQPKPRLTKAVTAVRPAAPKPQAVAQSKPVAAPAKPIAKAPEKIATQPRPAMTQKPSPAKAQVVRSEEAEAQKAPVATQPAENAQDTTTLASAPTQTNALSDVPTVPQVGSQAEADGFNFLEHAMESPTTEEVAPAEEELAPIPFDETTLKDDLAGESGWFSSSVIKFLIVSFALLGGLILLASFFAVFVKRRLSRAPSVQADQPVAAPEEFYEAPEEPAYAEEPETYEDVLAQEYARTAPQRPAIPQPSRMTRPAPVARMAPKPVTEPVAPRKPQPAERQPATQAPRAAQTNNLLLQPASTVSDAVRSGLARSKSNPYMAAPFPLAKRAATQPGGPKRKPTDTTSSKPFNTFINHG